MSELQLQGTIRLRNVKEEYMLVLLPKEMAESTRDRCFMADAETMDEGLNLSDLFDEAADYYNRLMWDDEDE